MQNSNHEKRALAEDIFYGQVVINWARWFVVAVGIALILAGVWMAARKRAL